MRLSGFKVFLTPLVAAAESALLERQFGKLSSRPKRDLGRFVCPTEPVQAFAMVKADYSVLAVWVGINQPTRAMRSDVRSIVNELNHVAFSCLAIAKFKASTVIAALIRQRSREKPGSPTFDVWATLLGYCDSPTRQLAIANFALGVLMIV